MSPQAVAIVLVSILALWGWVWYLIEAAEVDHVNERLIDALTNNAVLRQRNQRLSDAHADDTAQAVGRG
jgi:hypothetical protein